MSKIQKLVAAMMLACGALLLMRAATASSDDTPPMTSYRNDTLRIVKYEFSYKLPDGSEAEEEGVLKNAGTDAEVLSVKGSIHWFYIPKGFHCNFTYLADENGFRINTFTEWSSVPSHVVASLLGR